MNKDKEAKLSKYLSYVLRHNPTGYSIDENGWVPVQEFLPDYALADILYVVKHNSKQRFEMDDAQLRIRARQGHSISVDLQFEEMYVMPLHLLQPIPVAFDELCIVP